jgi:hypothetical protein
VEATMKRPLWQLAGWVLAAALPVANASAQDNDLKGMAGMASSPLSSGSMGNVAGLLQYCIGKGLLSEESVAPVKDQLIGKLPAGAKTEDRGYSDGLKGVLHGSNGNLMDLSGGGGLTADITRKACDTVLAQARSFL